MDKHIRIIGTAIILSMAAMTPMSQHPAMAASAAEINRDAAAALKLL